MKHAGTLSITETDFIENASFLWVAESKFSQFRVSLASFSVVPHLDFLQGTKNPPPRPHSLSILEAGSPLLAFHTHTHAMLGLGDMQWL